MTHTVHHVQPSRFSLSQIYLKQRNFPQDLPRFLADGNPLAKNTRNLEHPSRAISQQPCYNEVRSLQGSSSPLSFGRHHSFFRLSFTQSAVSHRRRASLLRRRTINDGDEGNQQMNFISAKLSEWNRARGSCGTFVLRSIVRTECFVTHGLENLRQRNLPKRRRSRISVSLFVSIIRAVPVRPLFSTSITLLLTVRTFLLVMTVVAVFNLVTFVVAMVIAFLVFALLAKRLLVIVRVVVARFVVATLGHLSLVIRFPVVRRVTVFVELVEELGSFLELVLRR